MRIQLPNARRAPEDPIVIIVNRVLVLEPVPRPLAADFQYFGDLGVVLLHAQPQRSSLAFRLGGDYGLHHLVDCHVRSRRRRLDVTPTAWARGYDIELQALRNLGSQAKETEGVTCIKNVVRCAGKGLQMRSCSGNEASRPSRL